MNINFERNFSLLMVLIWTFHFASFAQDFPNGFTLEEVATDLNPTRMTQAPDDRIYVSEKDGDIYILENDILLEDPFLSIEVEEFNERGLQGLVFHPDYEINHWFYVFYTVPQSNNNRVSRFTANGNFAIPTSEEVLFEMDDMAGSVHNGGSMHFGLDGKLYIGSGEGGSGLTSQNLNTTLGKVLRLNEDGSIPTDNPFYNSLSGNKRAIYATGLRNPFNFSIEKNSGRILMNDVGGGDWEEVNDILPGKNYGWSLIEGYIENQNAPPNYQDPLYAYSHANGCAITGSEIYQPEDYVFPAQYHDKYFFGDYCSGEIRVLDQNTGDILEIFGSSISRPIGIISASDGSLYYLERSGPGDGSTGDNSSANDGRIWKVTYTGVGLPFVGQQPNDALMTIGDSAIFSINATGTPPLTYQWKMDGVNIPGEIQESMLFENALLSDDGILLHCEVSNGFGTTSSDEATISVTSNTRPEGQITTTSETYKAGEFIFFSGTAFDAEDGPLEDSDMKWRIEFHHDIHSHPAMSEIAGIANGSFLIPTVGEISTDVWYRIHLEITDSEGLIGTQYLDVIPEITNIDVQTQPENLNLFIDGQYILSPINYESVSGISRTIIAPTAQTRDSLLFVFDRWKNGSSNSNLSFDTPANDTSFTAIYDSTPLASGTGLKGSYYSDFNGDFENLPKPTLTRIDSIIDFNWGIDSPDSLVSDDNFAVRYEGYVWSLFEGEYTFYVLADNGFRLKINGATLLDQIPEAWSNEFSVTVHLAANTQYPIQLDFLEDQWSAALRLSWSHEKVPYELIRTSQLNPFFILGNTGEPYEGLDIFPNPSSNLINIWSDYPVEVSHIFDSMGKSYPIESVGSLNSQRINVQHLKPGLYFLRLLRSEKTIIHKIVVQ